MKQAKFSVFLCLFVIFNLYSFHSFDPIFALSKYTANPNPSGFRPSPVYMDFVHILMISVQRYLFDL